jgi:hypothetical protein
LFITGCDSCDFKKLIGKDCDKKKTEITDETKDNNSSENNNSTENNNTNIADNNDFKFYNLAELGTIVNGDVSISSRDEQYDFYTSTTDENGFYSVDPIKLLENVDNRLNTRPTYVLVTVQNGTDIDVNDDGIADADGGKPLLGKIKALYKLDTITTQGGLAVNLLSTPIAEALKNEEFLDEDKFNDVVEKFGVKDINEDGVVDNKDIYQYRMVDNNSSLEDKLRTELLNHIHMNDTSKISEVTNELKQEFGIITYNYTINGSTALIQLNPTNNLANIQYGKNLKSGDLLNEIYSFDISLDKNDYIVYKECLNSSCGTLNILAFDGTEVKNYFVQSVESNIYSDIEHMNSLRQSIIDKTKELNLVNQSLIEKEVILEERKKELLDLQEQQESLGEQYL